MSGLSLFTRIRSPLPVGAALLALLVPFSSSALGQAVQTTWIEDLPQAEQIWQQVGRPEGARSLLEIFSTWSGWPEPSVTIDLERPAVVVHPFEGLAAGTKGMVFLVPVSDGPEAWDLLRKRTGGSLAEGEAARWAVGGEGSAVFHLVRRGGYLAASFDAFLAENTDVAGLLASRVSGAGERAVVTDLNVERISPMIEALLGPGGENVAGGDGKRGGVYELFSPSDRRFIMKVLPQTESLRASLGLEGETLLLRVLWRMRPGTWLDRLVLAQEGAAPAGFEAVDTHAPVVAALSLRPSEVDAEAGNVAVGSISRSLLSWVVDGILDDESSKGPDIFGLASLFPGECTSPRWQLSAGAGPSGDDLLFVSTMKETGECARKARQVAERLMPPPPTAAEGGEPVPEAEPWPDPPPGSPLAFRLDAYRAPSEEGGGPVPSSGESPPPAASGASVILGQYSGRGAIVAGRWGAEENLDDLLHGHALEELERERASDAAGPFVLAPGLVVRVDPIRWRLSHIDRSTITAEAGSALDEIAEEWEQRGGPLVAMLGIRGGAVELGLALSPQLVEFEDEISLVKLHGMRDRVRQRSGGGGAGGGSTAGERPAVDWPAAVSRDGLASKPEGEVYVPDNEEVLEPVLIPSSRVPPRYPARARWTRTEGRVVLQTILDKEGKLSISKLLDAPDPDRGLTRAAIEAVRQWRYEPCRKGGEPVSCYMTVVVNFTIEDSEPDQ